MLNQLTQKTGKKETHSKSFYDSKIQEHYSEENLRINLNKRESYTTGKIAKICIKDICMIKKEMINCELVALERNFMSKGVETSKRSLSLFLIAYMQ